MAATAAVLKLRLKLSGAPPIVENNNTKAEMPPDHNNQSLVSSVIGSCTIHRPAT